MLDGTYIKEIDGKWYAFGIDEFHHQAYSIGSDCPDDGGLWIARWSDEGIKYVASPSKSRSGAYQKARRWGNYRGEW